MNLILLKHEIQPSRWLILVTVSISWLYLVTASLGDHVPDWLMPYHKDMYWVKFLGEQVRWFSCFYSKRVRIVGRNWYQVSPKLACNTKKFPRISYAVNILLISSYDQDLILTFFPVEPDRLEVVVPVVAKFSCSVLSRSRYHGSRSRITISYLGRTCIWDITIYFNFRL